MARYLVTLSLGPVQGLIGAARRTRDLWCGSWLLSEAARSAAHVLHQAHPHCLVFPAPNNPDEELLPLDAPGDEANIANVLRAEVALDGGTAAVGSGSDETALRVLCDRAAQAARGRLAELGTEARAMLKGRDLREEVWRAQIRDVLEVFAAWVPFDQGTRPYQDAGAQLGSVLAARKATRDFAPAALGAAGAGLPKSSLDGAFETVLPEAPGPSLVRALRLSNGEQLDALGVIKRLSGDAEQFTAYARIAADPWIEQLTASQQARLRDAYEHLVRFDHATRVRGNARCYDPFPYDAQLLYDFRLRNARRQQNLEPGAEDPLKDLQESLHQVRRDVGRFGDRNGDPVPYGVILQADGDRMGELLSRAETAEQSRQVSQALHAFASELRALVREHRGHAIYAGGDDVLALVPLAGALSCARALAVRFAERLGPVAEALGLPRELQPTLSVGLGIGHLMEPLGSLRARALRAERVAKGDAQPADRRRNALGIVLGIRSGGETEWRARWDDADTLGDLETFTQAYRAHRLPSRAAYDLRAIDRRLAWLSDESSGAGLPPDPVARGMRQAEVRRMLDRARRDGGREAIPDDLQERIVRRSGQVALAQLADTLIVARWLAARTRADVEAR